MNSSLSVPERIGLGMAAGAVGTLVMTVGQAIEIAITDRPPSATPAKAVEKLTRIELATADDEQRASTPIHWAYGTILGGLLAALDRVPEPARTGLFFASAWGGSAVLLNALGLAQPPQNQKPRDLVTDIGHHAVYAISAGAAFALFINLAEDATTAEAGES